MGRGIWKLVERENMPEIGVKYQLKIDGYDFSFTYKTMDGYIINYDIDNIMELEITDNIGVYMVKINFAKRKTWYRSVGRGTLVTSLHRYHEKQHMKITHEGTYKRYNRAPERDVILRFENAHWCQFDRRQINLESFGSLNENELERAYDSNDGVMERKYVIYEDTAHNSRMYARFENGTWYECRNFGTTFTRQNNGKEMSLDSWIEDSE